MKLDKLKELQAEFGEGQELAEVLENMGDEGLQGLRLLIKIQTAQRFDNADAFEAFFNVCYGLPLMPHSKRSIEAAYAAKKRGKGLVLKMHRDSAKTTVAAQAFIAFRLGKEPNLSWLIIQAGDEIASANAEAIATLIQQNQGWNAIFPNIRPWPKREGGKGWSENGYWLIDTDKSGEWGTLIGTRKDPSLVGLTWDSNVMVGRRPTGGIIFDDVHNEKNSSSETLMAKVLITVKETIMPMLTKDPSKKLKDEFDDARSWKIAIGTPWQEGDVLDWFSSLTTFENFFLPLFVLDDLVQGEHVDENTPGAVYFDPPMPPGAKPRWVVPNWPEKFDLDYIYEKYEEVGGEAGFVRQYLLDSSKSAEKVFRWQSYPHDQIKPAKHDIYVGVDPAFLMEDAHKLPDYKSEFAICYSAVNQDEVLVPFGGVNVRCTIFEGMKYLIDVKQAFPFLKGIWVETDGIGAVFYDMVRKQYPQLRGIVRKASTGGRGKLQRHVEADIPNWMGAGRIKISDVEDDSFITALKKQLNSAPNWKRSDCADAFYYSIYGARHRLRLPWTEDDTKIPTVMGLKKEPYRNPVLNLGDYRGT